MVVECAFFCPYEIQSENDEFGFWLVCHLVSGRFREVLLVFSKMMVTEVMHSRYAAKLNLQNG